MHTNLPDESNTVADTAAARLVCAKRESRASKLEGFADSKLAGAGSSVTQVLSELMELRAKVGHLLMSHQDGVQHSKF